MLTPSYQDDWLTIYGGDCRTVLAELSAESVHCVVTSPPYWGLRDYGTATWEGGADDCDHRLYGHAPDKPTPGGRGGSMPMQEIVQRESCRKCGARRIDSQLGLEPTTEQYVENMVAVFREVRRVLRSDGTVWLNLGDSYAANWSSRRPEGGGGFKEDLGRERITKPPPGLKSKDLVGIPWRVAFALQADGWYLRSDIIWSKPNPMPESVTDRPTKSHEYLFLLAKSPRYYFDADAVSVKSDNAGGRAGYAGYSARAEAMGRNPSGNEKPGMVALNGATRNIRTVWTVATQPYPGAHFAVFPEKLIEPCILAGTSERGVCPECGKPWRRVTETTKYEPEVVEPGVRNVDASRGDKVRKLSGADYNEQVQRRTLSWIPSCAHDAEPVGALVLDPFGGSGTTARVANRLSRRAVLIDLNPDYLKQQMDRNRDLPLGLGA